MGKQATTLIYNLRSEPEVTSDTTALQIPCGTARLEESLPPSGKIQAPGLRGGPPIRRFDAEQHWSGFVEGSSCEHAGCCHEKQWLTVDVFMQLHVDAHLSGQ